MYTQVSMAFIVIIAYDARNKFHNCMSKFFQVWFIFWTLWPKLWQFWVSVVAILKMFNCGYHKNQVICPDICMNCYIAGHQYTKFHANIQMQTKVIAILSFRCRPFWNFLMEAIAKSGDMSKHLVWFGIQLTINTHIFMQIFTYITKL